MTSVLRLHSGEVDLDHRHFRRAATGERATLSDVEVRLLAFLAARPGDVVPRDVLLREVWGYSARVVSRTVDTTIWRLRQKLEVDPASPVSLLTVPNAGYSLRCTPLSTTPARLEGDPVERSRLWAALGEAVAGARLVTLSGPGGAGKTTVARAFAAERGAPFVRLEGRRTLSELVLGIAETLGLSAVDDAASLGRALAARGVVLLVLDDLDHAVAAASALVTVLASTAPAVRVVCTSRERLARPGEVVVPVHGMTDAEALELFARRRSGDGEGWSDPARVAAVLAAVDRLPLAIELVAGWVDVLPADALAARLDRQLDLLRATSPETGRHLDLRTVVSASWELLPEGDRLGLRTLAVFEGDFTLAEAEALSPLAPLWLRALVRRSLVQAEGDGFRLYTAVRWFAREQGTPEGVEARHRTVLEDRVQRLLAALETVGRPAAVADALRGRRDLEARFSSAEAAGEAVVVPIALLFSQLAGHAADRAAWLERAHRAAAPTPGSKVRLAVLYKQVGRLNEAFAVARECLSTTAPGDEWHAEALDVLGLLERDHGDPVRAERLMSDAIAAARAAGTPVALARYLVDRAWLFAGGGRTEEALAGYREALATFPAEVPARRAAALSNLANLYRETGRDPLPLLEESLALHRRACNRQGEGIVAGSIAAWHTERGSLDEAERWFDEALAAFREVGNRHAELVFVANRSYLHRTRGDLDAATRDLEEVRDGLAALADTRMIGMCEGGLGEIALARGEWAAAGEHLTRAVAASARNPKHAGVFGGALGVVLAHHGDRAGALAALDAAERALLAAGMEEERLRVHFRRASALASLGEAAAAAVALAEAEVQVREPVPRWLAEARDAARSAVRAPLRS